MSDYDEDDFGCDAMECGEPGQFAKQALHPRAQHIERTADEEAKPQNYCQWATSDNLVFTPACKTTDVILPGVYEINCSPNIGLFFRKIPVKTEGLLKFPDSNSDRVVGEIQKFWEREDAFREYGLTFKRGILLYGPPGSGKSCTVQLIMADVIAKGGIAVNFRDPNLFIEGLRVLRQIQPKCPVVTILEDIEATIQMYSESEILNILDGVNDVDHTVFLATTNYPKMLGPRIVNRPSRFDKRFKIGHPSDVARKMYFENLIGDRKVKELGIDLNKWVEDTDKMSIAHLKELFIAVVILGDDYKDAIRTLGTMKEPLDDREYDNPMGFAKAPPMIGHKRSR
jgi:hypothetical protein